MAFKPQASQLRSGGASVKAQKNKEMDPLAYLMLGSEEIVRSLQELGIPCDINAINNPSTQHVCIVLENLLDHLTGINNATATPITNAILNNVEHGDTMVDSIKILACFRSLRTVLRDGGLQDFTMNDMLAPEKARVIRIYSVMINLQKYHQDRKTEIEQFTTENGSLSQKMEELYTENDAMAQDLEKLALQKDREAILCEKTEAEIKENYEDLRKLHELQKSLTMDRDKLKMDKQQLQAKIEDAEFTKATLSQEISKIRPYIVDSPSRLAQTNTDMSTTLASEKSQIAAVERRSRALFTSADSFSVIEADVTACIKVMEECEAELLREEEELRKAQRHRDVLRKKGLEVQDWEKKEQTFQARFVVTQDKVIAARKQAEQKASVAKKKMGELNETYQKLASERNERSYEIERMKDQINKVERVIAAAKEQFEEEVRSAQQEFMKLNNHIMQYMDEMHKVMGVEA